MKKILCMLALIVALVCVVASCNKAPEFSISDDGYWVINGEKTDVKAQGEQGIQGEKGDKGDKGDSATVTDENPLGLAFFLKDDGTYAVEIGQAKYLSKIEIPATYKGKAVTEVGVFGNGSLGVANSVLKEIAIPNSVTTIGDWAFSGCSSLTSVTIPDSVTSIGCSAFSGCSALTGVTIPDSVTSIGDRAFYRCTSLTSVTIGDSVTSIGSGAFSGCTSLTSVTIGDSVTSIGHGAFRECTSLTSVTIPDSVTSIGGYAFYWCTSLTSLIIPDSVTSIGDYAFSSCTSLTSVTFANPNGWECENIYDASVIAISASDLSNPATAAEYLKSTYDNYYWYRTE